MSFQAISFVLAQDHTLSLGIVFLYFLNLEQFLRFSLFFMIFQKSTGQLICISSLDLGSSEVSLDQEGHRSAFVLHLHEEVSHQEANDVGLSPC